MASGTASKRAPAVAPRVYPTGRAVVLLGVCAPELAGRRLTIEGRRVQVVRYAKFGLIVSFVDQAGYASDELALRRADPAWLACEARLLEAAVERARATVAVLPMRLLTVYPHPAALEAAAREAYPRWTRALARLGGKRECAVHLFAGPHARPGGEPYVMRVSARTTRSARLPAMTAESDVARCAEALWHACAGIATSTRRIAAQKHGALWSATMLVDEDDVPKLTALVEGAARAGSAIGISAYLEQPRAAFSFV